MMPKQNKVNADHSNLTYRKICAGNCISPAQTQSLHQPLHAHASFASCGNILCHGCVDACEDGSDERVSPDPQSGVHTIADLRNLDLTLSEDPQLIVYIHWLIVENSYNVQIPAQVALLLQP
jgi:hypothetical protein